MILKHGEVSGFSILWTLTLTIETLIAAVVNARTIVTILQVLCNWLLFIIIGSIILTLTGIAFIFWIVEAHGQITQLGNSNITRPVPPQSDRNITIPDQVYVIYNG